MLQKLSMGDVKVESDCALLLFMRVNTRRRFMVGKACGGFRFSDRWGCFHIYMNWYFAKTCLFVNILILKREVGK